MVSAVGNLGSIAVFGGMLRDLALAPASNFRSDIDLVISTEFSAELDKKVKLLGGVRNRYGGRRVQRGRWAIDIWALKDTWAFRTGLVPDPSFSQLTHTTFFNWDSIVLSMESGRLWHSEDYFSALENRVLEITLEPNANPSGNVTRALNYLREGARFGPKLSRYVSEFLSGRMTSLVPPADTRPSNGHSLESFLDELASKLQRHLSETPNIPFELHR